MPCPRALLKFQQAAVNYQQTVLSANAEAENAISSFLKAQEALEDAILMGCDEAQMREVFEALVASLENPYAKKD